MNQTQKRNIEDMMTRVNNTRNAETNKAYAEKDFAYLKGMEKALELMDIKVTFDPIDGKYSIEEK